jgi:multicomponent Na+:H+ antiporter subunit C
VNLVFALVVAVLFGTGAYLLLSRDLMRVVLGVVVISQAATLTIVAAGQVRGAAPIHPMPDGRISDPLSQAMALTAIVIGMAVTALLLALVLRVVRAYRSPGLDEVAEEEVDRQARLDAEAEPVQEQEEAAAR